MKYFLIIICFVFALVTTSFILHKAIPQTKPTQEIKLTPCEPSTEFPNAGFTNYTFSNGIGDSQSFNYQFQNYTLGEQTPDASSKFCANSAKGQHIHLILNNQPYEAWYIPSFKKKLPDGHYVALSFLSRSYHESIKKKDAYILDQFNVGENFTSKKGNINLKKPLLFYSRPKGEYVGDDTKKILLDFYVTNVQLSANGNKVRATINGKEFMITDWKPFFIEGLPMGESTIKLELLDKDNKPAGKETMFQTIERKITLKEK